MFMATAPPLEEPTITCGWSLWHSEERLVEAALPCDPVATIQIAKWIYEQTEKANGQVWVTEKVLQRLGSTWPQCLSA
jgi:hypothetical protein